MYQFGAYKTWFSRLKPVSLDFEKGVATIEAPNEFHMQTLLRCYSELLKQALQNVFGDSITFALCVKEDEAPPAGDESSGDDGYELTFDTFVVGPSNRFAHAACHSIQSPVHLRQFRPGENPPALRCLQGIQKELSRPHCGICKK